MPFSETEIVDQQRLGLHLRWVGVLLLCCSVSACDSRALSSTSKDQRDSAGAQAERHKQDPGGGTMSFVLSGFEFIYPAKDAKAECPEGLLYSNEDNWRVQFPTRTARQAHLDRCGDSQNRGPNCENVWLSPELIEDPLPFREVKGKIAYGVDLDGMQNGGKAQSTCAHEEFTGPDGEPGVDNQYYRFLGCTKGVRTWNQDLIKKLIGMSSVYRLLLVVSGVDDEQNDNGVEVALYRGRDQLTVDASGRVVPWQSQRIDAGPRQLIHTLRGKIVDDMLLTEPADVVWEDLLWEQRLLIHGMSLRLKLSPSGAEGLRVGYIDAQRLWQRYARHATGGGWSGSAPAAYAALHRLADGHRDPQTGACTALSSARKIEFVRAHVMHSAREMAP